MAIRLLAYRNTPSARSLARALGIRRLRQVGSLWRAKESDVVVNFGSSVLPKRVKAADIINHPSWVEVAVNKLDSLVMLASSGVSTPRFATDAAEANEWGRSVVVRRKLRASKGDGIEIYGAGCAPAGAPLYVEYIPKKQEYRVHVVSGKDAWVDRKARSFDVPLEEVNWQVRNHSNGFIYERNVDAPEGVLEQGIAAVEALSLDYAAVDVVWNERSGLSYVLEVNTAPGMVGATLEQYVNNLREVIYE